MAFERIAFIVRDVFRWSSTMVDIAMNIVSLSQREFNEGGQRRSRLGNRVRNRQHGLNEMESLS